MKNFLIILAVFLTIISTSQAQNSSEFVAAMNKGQQLLTAGKMDEAIDAYRRASEINPQHSAVYAQLGVIYYTQKKFSEAAAMMQKAVELNPWDAIAQNSLGMIYLAQDNLKAAVGPLEKAYELSPEIPHLAGNLMRLYRTLGQVEKSEQIQREMKTSPTQTAKRAFYRALVAFESGDNKTAITQGNQAAQLEPQMIEAKQIVIQAYINTGQYEKAAIWLKEVASTTSPDAEAYLTLGRIYYKLKRNNESLAAFLKLSELVPDHLEAHEMAGRIFINLNQPDKAVPHLQRAVQIAPRSAPAYRELAIAYRDLNRNKECIEILQQITALAPEDVMSFQILGYLLMADNRYDEAIVVLQRALALKPDDQDIQHTLGSAQKAVQNRPDLAKLQGDVVKYPKNSAAHYHLATAYDYYGKRDKALTEYHLAYELEPERLEAMRGYAFALQTTKQYEKALQVFQKFYANKPDSQEKHFYLGSVYYDLNNYTEAIKHLSKVLEIKPEATHTAWLLAEAYAANGQPENAIATLEQLLQRAPDYANALHQLGILYLNKGQTQKATQCYQKLHPINPGLAESLGRKIEGR